MAGDAGLNFDRFLEHEIREQMMSDGREFIRWMSSHLNRGPLTVPPNGLCGQGSRKRTPIWTYGRESETRMYVWPLLALLVQRSCLRPLCRLCSMFTRY